MVLVGGGGGCGVGGASSLLAIFTQPINSLRLADLRRRGMLSEWDLAYSNTTTVIILAHSKALLGYRVERPVSLSLYLLLLFPSSPLSMSLSLSHIPLFISLPSLSLSPPTFLSHTLPLSLSIALPLFFYSFISSHPSALLLVCVCVCACVRACVRVCVCVCPSLHPCTVP